MKLREAHIWWAAQYDENWKAIPNAGRVVILPFGPQSWHMDQRGFQSDTGACLADWRELPLDKLVMKLFAETAGMVARDGVDPHQLHAELCKIEEYCWLLAPDVPGSSLYGKVSLFDAAFGTYDEGKTWADLLREDFALTGRATRKATKPTEEIRRRDRMKANGGLRFRVLKRDGYRCQLCGVSAQDGARLHIDHKVPRKLGGTNSIDNLWVLCADCNQSKSDAPL